MGTVLGIDAAWTETQPTGVALTVGGKDGWQLVAASPSYGDFLGGHRSERAVGGIPDATKLLDVAKRLAREPVSLIAVDMPLATEPITKRRLADNYVSCSFGKKHASTHSPSEKRPGSLSDNLRKAFDAQGYPLATGRPLPSTSLIEVYPHPALIVLSNANERLLYKLRKYPKAERAKLIAEWHRILGLLDQEISGCKAQLVLPRHDDPIHRLKAFEDMLDAVVCCWVGICALEGRAEPLGDKTAAIWVPDCEEVKQFRKPGLSELMKNANGMIESGVPDLATNPKHLEGFGKDSMGR